MYKNYSGLFTSESVSEGHPDKIADQISDTVLDQILMQDKNASVACETVIKNSLVIVSGEVTTTAWINIEDIVKNVLKDIGYDDSRLGLDYRLCTVINLISQQSPELRKSVKGKKDVIAAGDQGIMFGYATDETPEYMPAAFVFANRLLSELAHLRKTGAIKWLGPDSKSQVTVEYKDGKLVGIHTILISTQHHADVDQKTISETLIKDLINKQFPKELISDKTKILINPGGSFILGGPQADCGLTGRKIIVDTYGGYAKHGGGAFSGKDPSKMDRSAAYMGRYVAKSLVKSKLASRCEVQVSYALGLEEPISISVDTFGTSEYSDEQLVKVIEDNFDLRTSAIIRDLDLLRPIYRKTASYGHFGKQDKDFSWENAKELRVI